MKLLGNKILIRITKANRENIYSKEITRVDGSKVRLFKSYPADEHEARKAELYVQTAMVEAVSEKVKDVFVGDIAIINYDLCNARAALAYMDGEDEVFWLDAVTTYHKETEVANANRKGSRDQIVYTEGDYDELSPLLGVIRGDELISRDPYVFLAHQPPIEKVQTQSGIIYDKKLKIFEREVLAASSTTTEKYNIGKGDLVTVDDFDVFKIKISDDHFIDCVNDIDILTYKQV